MSEWSSAKLCDVVNLLLGMLLFFSRWLFRLSAGACDLIVMASHGRHGISAIVLGSETLKVLTHSKIPVLVYR